jgi:hypothetical protein
MRRYRIGRAETNDVVLAEATVSREHAELTELGGGRFSIKDLGSTYGTSIRRGQDWDKIGEAELQQDTPLRLGEYQTTVAGLLRDTDRTMVRATTPAPSAPPSPPKARAPQSAPAANSTPAAGSAASAGSAAPPRPATPALPWRNLPPEKRTLMWLLVGLGAFLLVALITLVVVLAVGGGGDQRTGRLDRPRADAPRAQAPRAETPPSAPRGDAPRPGSVADGAGRFLETCLAQWKFEERRCRCLAGAAKELQGADYADFAEAVRAYAAVTAPDSAADLIQAGEVFRRVAQARGAAAHLRLLGAFRSAARECA